MGRVILASQSPRRREILSMLLPAFSVIVSNTQEICPENASPCETVQTLAAQKAHAVARDYPDALVIGADTLVYLDGRPLGKPKDKEDAAGMLRALSGRAHEVYTGVCLCTNEESHTFDRMAAVHFAPLTQREIDWYIATGDPMDKAGAYGIQGPGARFIKGIEGDFFTVMGLPLNALYENIGRFSKFLLENS